MNNWLVLLGILIIIYALWRERTKENRITSEVNNYQKIRDELVTTKKEVQVLMEQLEAASEKIVEEISVGLEEIKHQSEQSPKSSDAKAEPETINENTDGEISSFIEAEKAPRQVVAENSTVPSLRESGHKTSVKKKASLKTPRSDNTIAFPSLKTRHQNSAPDLKNEKLPVPPVPPKHQMVYAMAGMGYTEEEIARQMKIGKGEVNLMLQLKRKGEKENV